MKTDERASVDAEASPGLPGRTRWALLTVALAATILLGRMLVIRETNLALYWPAGGVAVLGVAGARNARELRVVLLTIFVMAMGGNLVTGVPPLASTLLGLSNVVVGIVPALWLRVAPGSLRRPDVTPGAPLGAVLAVTSTTDLCRVAVAVTVGALASAVPGAVTMLLLSGSVTSVALVSWVVRLSVGALVVALPLLTVAWLTDHRGLATQPASASQWRAWWRAHRGETLGLVLIAVAVVAAIFGPSHTLPLTYLPVVFSVWSGVRLPPVVAGVVALGIGLLTVAATLFLGAGPFADVIDSRGQAMTVQGYAVLLVAVALVLSLVIAERDTLSRRLVEAQVEATRRADDLAVVTETVPVGLIVLSHDRTVEMANPAARALSSSLVDADGRLALRWRRPDGSVLPLAEYPSHRAMRGFPCRGVLMLDGPPADAATRTWSVDAVALPSSVGSDVRALVSLRNVTDEQQHLAQLESFAGVVAHDLQNPVTAARGWTDVAVEELVDAEIGPESGVRQALERARGATDRAVTLIQDLLDYSVGRTAAIRRDEVDLDRLAASVVSGVEQAYAARTPIVVVGPLGRVTGDRVLLGQLLTNLIGNAVKYTPPDRVPEVTVSAAGDDADLEITVSDRGVGVPESQRTSIFEPFSRAHGDDSRFTGTGLGLAICAQAAARHGGSVRVEPREDGEGSHFVVTLPRTTTTAGTTASTPPAAAPRQRSESDERLPVS